MLKKRCCGRSGKASFPAAISYCRAPVHCVWVGLHFENLIRHHVSLIFCVLSSKGILLGEVFIRYGSCEAETYVHHQHSKVSRRIDLPEGKDTAAYHPTAVESSWPRALSIRTPYGGQDETIVSCCSSYTVELQFTAATYQTRPCKLQDLLPRY